MAGWFLIFFASSILIISVFLNDPTLKGYGTSFTSHKIETPNIKTSQVLGVHTVGDERIPLLRGYLQAKDLSLIHI